jgi:energy-coupling factor transporter ATP-binding protein EcfA2
MTNHRADAFRKSYQNLQLWPLVTPEKIRDFRVEYGQEVLEQLTQLVEDCSANNNKIIFTGHRGSGKSTLLGQFSLEMKDKYFVVRFSIADMIEMYDVNHINILFAMAVKLMEEAETQKVKIGNKTKQAFYEWFSEHTKTETRDISFINEIETTVKAGADAWFVKFFAQLKDTLKANEVIRDEIKKTFARRISELVDRVNDIAIAIQAASKKQILVIIDDLDKLPLEVVETVYRKNITPLFQPHFRIIYTIPMTAMRDKVLRGIISGATNNRILCMWATKFFSKGQDKIPEAIPKTEAVKLFSEVLQKRLPRELMEENVAEQLILKSGGALRELIRLASRCCEHCLMQLRRNPDLQDLKITTEILQKAVTDLRIEFTESLGQNDMDILLQIYDKNLPKDGMNQLFLDLLHTLYILEYRNDDVWFGLHPIVREILLRRELI